MTQRPHRPADWLSVEDAIARVLMAVQPLPAERVRLDEAAGRTLAERIVPALDLPPWDNSAMDGFATRAEDVRGATAAAPVRLRIVEHVPAGGFPSRAVGPGEAIRIMTGAPMPAGADGVVRIEHTRTAGEVGFVLVLEDGDAGRNVRPRGEDVRAGEVLFEPGRRLRAAEIGALAAIGVSDVAVHVRPRIALLATGDELADLDAFDEVRAGRRIANSNTWSLGAAVREVGGEPVPLGIARDDASSLRIHIERGLDADALITTAGASVGDHDLVKDALDELGFQLDFWRVRMRPGSPFSFGRLPRPGLADLPVFGLPGNPVSALVTFLVLVRPALRKMAGRSDVHARTVRVRAAHDITSKRGLTHFLRVTLETDPRGGLQLARLTGPQGSGLLSSMAAADALLVVPFEVDVVPAGTLACALPLDPPDVGVTAIAFPPAAPSTT
jgi:molybdopterin molybdotransferase